MMADCQCKSKILKFDVLGNGLMFLVVYDYYKLNVVQYPVTEWSEQLTFEL